MIRSIQLGLSAATFILQIVGVSSVFATQVVDEEYLHEVGKPSYSVDKGPVIHIDEAHNNAHTAVGTYRPMVQLLKSDGYVVKRLTSKINNDSLKNTDVLVIANALNDMEVKKVGLSTPSAFETIEIEALDTWVKDGGSLLLIADHMPYPAAIESLAERFGFIMGNGYVLSANFTNKPEEYISSNRIKFFVRNGEATDGSFMDHPISNGRSQAESIPFVTSFTGQGFWLAPGSKALPLMVLGKGSRQLYPETVDEMGIETPSTLAAGMLQGAAVEYGSGRVALFGEAGMFTAQRFGEQQEAMGMNNPEAPHNAQFTLNVFHWLTGLLP